MDVFALGRLGLDAVGAVASASLDLAAIPLREGAKIMAGDRSDLTSRRSWRGAGRAWIEVHGLDDTDGADLGGQGLEELRAEPGVTSVRLISVMSSDCVRSRCWRAASLSFDRTGARRSAT